MTKKQIIEKINALVAEEFEVPIDAITPNADIRLTLDLDSMRALEIVALARKQFGITLTPRQLPRFITFEDLYNYIYEHQ